MACHYSDRCGPICTKLPKTLGHCPVSRSSISANIGVEPISGSERGGPVVLAYPHLSQRMRRRICYHARPLNAVNISSRPSWDVLSTPKCRLPKPHATLSRSRPCPAQRHQVAAIAESQLGGPACAHNLFDHAEHRFANAGHPSDTGDQLRAYILCGTWDLILGMHWIHKKLTIRRGNG